MHYTLGTGSVDDIEATLKFAGESGGAGKKEYGQQQENQDEWL